MQFKYKALTGPMLSWLQIDEESLIERTVKCGGHSQVIRKQDDGNYLARLSFDNPACIRMMLKLS